MLSVVASLRRGRSAQSTLEPGLSANFKERKPKGKAKPPAPPANLIPVKGGCRCMYVLAVTDFKMTRV